MKKFWIEDNGYYWKGRWILALWSFVALVVIGGGVFIFGFAYPRWWEDHKTERGRGDAPVTGVVQDPHESESPEDGIIAIEMPDDFGNFATRCVWEGYRGFTTSNDGGAFVVPDPDCEMPTVLDTDEVAP